MNSNHSSSVNQESLIPCIEVLISRISIVKNIQWTLSVYSLENNPVIQHPAIHNCDVYHFMNFDWKRTVKQLLDDQMIPYSIIRYFAPQSIHAGIKPHLPIDGNTILSAVDQMEEMYGSGDSVSIPLTPFNRQDSCAVLDETSR